MRRKEDEEDNDFMHVVVLFFLSLGNPKLNHFFCALIQSFFLLGPWCFFYLCVCECVCN